MEVERSRVADKRREERALVLQALFGDDSEHEGEYEDDDMSDDAYDDDIPSIRPGDADLIVAARREALEMLCIFPDASEDDLAAYADVDEDEETLSAEARQIRRRHDADLDLTGSISGAQQMMEEHGVPVLFSRVFQSVSAGLKARQMVKACEKTPRSESDQTSERREPKQRKITA